MKAAFYTLGCKVNQYETEYMSELLRNAGFEIVKPSESADIYIVNSCTVTATADHKSRQNVRKFKRANPDATVILTGCMPQAFPKQAEELIEADIVLSNRSNDSILDLINEYNLTADRKVVIEEHKTSDAFGRCSIDRFSERIRAFVKIEDGCDRFCSYCIIPKARGRVRSKAPEDLKAEIETLAKNGIKEIVLVGINLSAYGKGFDYDITDAVKICNETDGIERIRLGSLEPDHITDEIIEKLSGFEKFCPHFHLSLQSGCDRTLRNMNRHYTAEEYENLCHKLRATFKDCALTTDVMVGFHEESEADFEESLEFVKKIAFEKVHTFPYSEREGTAASKRGDSVLKAVKERRAEIMITETDKIRNDYLRSLIGSDAEVLFESFKGNICQGYTRSYIPVKYKSNEDLTGVIKTVKIVGTEDDYCIAE